MEIVKGPFYSNCLLEALKAKIKHPIKVKITVVRHSETKTPHFLFSDGEYDYDFGVERYVKGLEILWFKGYIRRRELGLNERYKKRMEERYRGDKHGR